MSFPHIDHDTIQRLIERQRTPQARTTYYRIKNGRYAGMYHVRFYQEGRYFHIGRFKTEHEAKAAVDRDRSEPARALTSIATSV